MIVGCYSMDLYCRNHPVSTGSMESACRSQETFIGENAAECRTKARKYKWRFGPDGDVTCRYCLSR